MLFVCAAKYFSDKTTKYSTERRNSSFQHLRCHRDIYVNDHCPSVRGGGDLMTLIKERNKETKELNSVNHWQHV